MAKLITDRAGKKFSASINRLLRRSLENIPKVEYAIITRVSRNDIELRITSLIESDLFLSNSEGLLLFKENSIFCRRRYCITCANKKPLVSS